MKEVDRFLAKYNLPGLNQEETQTMNRPITNTEIKTVIKKKKQKKPFQKQKPRARWLHSQILVKV